MKYKKEHGHKLCWVTHPQRINTSGHSRGRVWHLQKGTSGKISICNMLITSFVDAEQDEIFDRVICKQCLMHANVVAESK